MTTKLMTAAPSARLTEAVSARAEYAEGLRRSEVEATATRREAERAVAEAETKLEAARAKARISELEDAVKALKASLAAAVRAEAAAPDLTRTSLRNSLSPEERAVITAWRADVWREHEAIRNSVAEPRFVLDEETKQVAARQYQAICQKVDTLCKLGQTADRLFIHPDPLGEIARFRELHGIEAARA